MPAYQGRGCTVFLGCFFCCHGAGSAGRGGPEGGEGRRLESGRTPRPAGEQLRACVANVCRCIAFQDAARLGAVRCRTPAGKGTPAVRNRHGVPAAAKGVTRGGKNQKTPLLSKGKTDEATQPPRPPSARRTWAQPRPQEGGDDVCATAVAAAATGRTRACAPSRIGQSESSASKLRRRAICHSMRAQEECAKQGTLPRVAAVRRRCQKKKGAAAGKKRGENGQEGKEGRGGV